MREHKEADGHALSYESERKECEDQFYSILRYIKKQPGYEVDEALLEKAYRKAEELHGDTRRHSGVLYLRHPLAVMESLSRLRCKTSILAAALLHDTMEDCGYSYESLRSSFKDEVAEIVSAVTAIKEVEKGKEAVFRDLTPEDRHALLDELTDAKLIKSGYQREALLVRLADREHNLSTIEACRPEKRRMKIEATQTSLIQAAKTLGMRYYEVVLRNYCLKYMEDPMEYRTLIACRNQHLSVSGPIFSEFDGAIQEAVAKQENFSFPSFNPFARMRGKKSGGQDVLQVERRRALKPVEIMDQLDGALTFERQDVCLNEVLLTSKETDRSRMLADFICFFHQYLKDKPMFFQYLDEDDYCVRLVLTDVQENNYLLVLVPEPYLEHYFIGNPNGKPLTMIDERSTADAVRPKITVYAYSTYKPLRAFEGLVPKGATALDFAFFISPALAHTVKHAKIKKRMGGEVSFSEQDYNYPLKTILEDGDVVHFDADYDPRHNYSVSHVTIDWFGYINTKRARNLLIDYYKQRLPREDPGQGE